MKKVNLLILAYILIACASAPQVTVTSEVTVTLPAPSVTPTETATPAPALPAEVLAYTVGKETVVNSEYKGVMVTTHLIADQTALDVKISSGGIEISLENVALNPDFTNKYGEDSEEALAHVVLYAQWRAWQENVTDDLKAERQNVGFDNWVEMVKTAQETDLQEDWDKVIFQASSNDLTTEDYDPEYRNFKPAGDIKIVYTNRSVSNLGTKFDNVNGYGWIGTGILSDNLVLFIGDTPKLEIYTKANNLNADSMSTLMLARSLFRLSMSSQSSDVSNYWDVFIKHARTQLDTYKILANPSEGSDVAIAMNMVTK